MAWRLATDPLIRELSPDKVDASCLVLASVFCGIAQLVYCSRWYWFLRAVRSPVTWSDAVFTGLVTQLLSAVALGSAGGDVYRGIALGLTQAGHRAGIVASIVADRVVGLYSLFCLAALAATFTPGVGRWQVVRATALPVLWAGVATGGAIILVGLFCNLGKALAWMHRFPILSRLLSPLLAVLERFHAIRGSFLLGIVSGMLVHAVNAVGLWLAARGLGVPHPTIAEHCLIGPLATCTAFLPLPMAGLGAVELVIDELYETAMPSAPGAGLVAALVGRLLALAVNALLVVAFFPLVKAARSRHRDGN